MPVQGKIKKNPFRNEGQPDYARDADKLRLQKILGQKVSPEFTEWYRQDYKGSGYTIPFMKYSGPGNPTNIGQPVNEADKFAQLHDLEYAHASFLFSKGKLNDDEFKAKVYQADTKFLKSNGFNMTSSMDPREQLASVIGGAGIGIKTVFERVFGQQYPNTDPNESFTPHPPGEKKLATHLMNNLKKSVSAQQSTSSDEDYDDDWDISEIQQLEGSFKRAGHSSMSGEPPTKKQAIGDQASGSASLPVGSATAAGAAPEDIEMAQLTGTGKEQASGGASSDGMMVHYIEKPFSMFSSRENVYTKSHKFMTFGLAPAFLTMEAAASSVCLTSYLAEIPWHIPAFYLNQSEYDLLQDGSYCKEVSIEIIYRGSTIQFETAATATGLATLNQINDIAVAHGLNRSGHGSNVRYKSFSAEQPMIPTSLKYPTYKPVAGEYRGMVRDYYGSDNNSEDFTGDVPKHQIGRQTFLYNYWVTTARGGSPDVAAGNKQFGGWPCLTDKIQQMDGKTVVNTCVAKSTFSPKIGPLKDPLRIQSHGLPWPGSNATVGVPVSQVLPNLRNANISQAAAAPSASIPNRLSTVEVVTTQSMTNPLTFDIYTPLEKSQYMRSGMWGDMSAHIQPSVHIGVQPVPALSTAASLAENGQFNQWTDTRAYWEVVATMKTVEKNPTHWPYATQANVPLGEVMVFNQAANVPDVYINPANDGATYAGLYTNSTNIID